MTISLLILLLCFTPQERQDYPLKNGRPTSRGIERYVEDKADSLILAYQNFIEDTLYNVYVYTDDLTDNGYYDPMELGRYYHNEVFITNTEVFMAYELDDLSQESRDTILSSNLFVKAAVFHELTHEYIHQISTEMSKIENIPVHRDYQAFFRVYRDPNVMGPKFIEEGICEYVCEKMGEIIPPPKPFIPKTTEDLHNPEYTFDVYYKYSAYCLTKFLDTTGLKRGIKILLHNPPPSKQEILNPLFYFTRLQAIE